MVDWFVVFIHIGYCLFVCVFWLCVVVLGLFFTEWDMEFLIKILFTK